VLTCRIERRKKKKKTRSTSRARSEMTPLGGRGSPYNSDNPERKTENVDDDD